MQKDRPSPGGTQQPPFGPGGDSFDPRNDTYRPGSGGGGGSAPKTGGGWWKSAFSKLDPIGRIAAMIAQKRAEARQAEIRALQEQDRLRLDFEQNRRNDDQNELDFEQNRRSDDQSRLDFERFNLQAPQMRSRNAVRGDIMAGVQDVQLTRPRGGGVKGGTRPSLLSPESRAMGKAMTREALVSQMNGPLSPTAPGQGPVQPSAPGSGPLQPTPMPGTNPLDNILNGIGYGGMVAGAAQTMNGAQSGTPPPSSSTSALRDPNAPSFIVPDEDLNPSPTPRYRGYVNPSLGAKFYAPRF